MLKHIVATLAFIGTPAWAAQAPFTGADHSGRYECRGVDSHIGDYNGVVELTLNTKQSTGKYGAYDFTLRLEDNSLYKGFAAGTADAMAIYFAHTDPSLKDYGVGTAQFVPTLDGKTAFTKYYYGPEYAGGGHGLEYCVKPS